MKIILWIILITSVTVFVIGMIDSVINNTNTTLKHKLSLVLVSVVSFVIIMTVFQFYGGMF